MKRQDLIVFAPTRRGPFELVIIPSCWAMLYSTDLLPVSQSLPPTRYGDGTLRHAGGRLLSTLEGGYDLAGLASAAAAHVGALI